MTDEYLIQWCASHLSAYYPGIAEISLEWWDDDGAGHTTTMKPLEFSIDDFNKLTKKERDCKTFIAMVDKSSEEYIKGVK